MRTIGSRILLSVTHVVVCVAWWVAVPPLESPDAPAHWDAVRHVANTGALLHSDGTPGYDAGQSFQAPLYYVVAGLILAPWRPVPSAQGQFEPASRRVGGSHPAFFTKTTHESVKPYFYLMAVPSVLGGLLAVLSIFELVRRRYESNHAATACALSIILVPQFGYISSSVSNDAVVAGLSALAFLLIVRLLDEPFRASMSLLAGAASGIAFLAKTNAIVLVGAGILACLLAALGHKNHKLLIRTSSAFLVGWLLVASGLLVRNVISGGHWLMNTQSAVQPHLARTTSLGDPYWWTTLPWDLLRTTFACFGYMTLDMPVAVYVVYGTTAAILGLGVVPALTVGQEHERESRRAVVLAAATVAMGLIALLSYNRHHFGNQARLLLPTIGAAGLLAAVGAREALARWPRQPQPALPLCWVGGLVSLWLFCWTEAYLGFRGYLR